MTRTHARSPKGKRAYSSCPLKKGENVSIIAAITSQKVLASINILGSVNGIIFEAFIIRKLIPQLWEGAVLTMDNCRIHFSQEIEIALQKKGVRLIYLPPYSPELAPIENFWSQVKSILRKMQPRTYIELDIAIKEAFKIVSQENLQNYFAHSCYCTPSI
jgi:transposase